MTAYFKPIARWTDAMQNDFAARADWCVKSYQEANHQPIVKLNHKSDLSAKPGSTVQLSAKGTYDPDGDQLTYHWWCYKEAGNFKGVVEIENAVARDASLSLPERKNEDISIHIVCEVKDSGLPQLTRYQRVIVKVKP